MKNHTDLQGGKTGMSKKRKNNSEFWYIVKVYLVSVIGTLMTVVLLVFGLFSIRPKQAYCYCEVEQSSPYYIDSDAYHYEYQAYRTRPVVEVEGQGLEFSYNSYPTLEVTPSDTFSIIGSIKVGTTEYHGLTFEPKANAQGKTEFYINVSDVPSLIISAKKNNQNVLCTFSNRDIAIQADFFRYTIPSNMPDSKQNKVVIELPMIILGWDCYEYTDSAHRRKLVDLELNQSLVVQNSGFSLESPNGSFAVGMHNGISNLMNKHILIDKVRRVTATGTGSLSMMYTEEPKKYDIINQELLLSSANNSLGVSLKQNETDGPIYMKASGTVYKTTISGLDILPSFPQWFRQNVYTLPTALLSVVVGSNLLANIITKREKRNNG